MFLPFSMPCLLGALFFILRVSPTSSFPKPLPPDEEAACIRAYRAGDLEARNKLIEHNLRLVAHIVKKYYAASEEQDDLISIGTIGLIKGVSTFDPDKNVRLATYASRCIENEILMHFRANRKSAGDISLDEPIESDSDGNALALMDVLSSPDDSL
ncbi:MAG: sigma-70 family RNA polymerase sigma factor, partial [Butyricicoccaceae bacterium]